MTDEFWKRKSLAEMTAEEWESLCDGCALCCLHKLEDEDSGEIYFADIACRLLDLHSCRCTDYVNRRREVPECLVLDSSDKRPYRWLPATCAYRLLDEGQDLPEWHPLVTGNPVSVHDAGISAKDKVMSENETSEWTALWQLGTKR